MLWILAVIFVWAADSINGAEHPADLGLRLSSTFHDRLEEAGVTSFNPQLSSPEGLRWLALQDELRRRAERPEASVADRAAFGALLAFNAHADKAVDVLESARELDASSASLANDLAVACFARYRMSEAPDSLDLFRALEAVGRSLRLTPSSEARLNLAILLQEVGLLGQSRREWQRFLQEDSQSPWAAIAQQRLAILLEPDPAQQWEGEKGRLLRAAQAGRIERVGEIVRRFPQQSRRFAEFELLGEWLAAREEDPALASALLLSAAEIGRVLSALYQERLLESTVQALKQADDAQVAHFAKGLAYFRSGRLHYEEGDSQAALQELVQASDQLGLASNPFRLWSEFYVALCHYQAFDWERANGRLRALDAQIVDRGFRILRARSAYTQGLIHGLNRRLPASAIKFREAIAELEGTPEYALVARFHNELATLLGFRGDIPESLAQMSKALLLGQHLADARRQSVFFSNAGFTLSDIGLYGAASFFFNEAVRAARESGGPADIAQTLRLRAGNGLALEDDDGADRDVREARGLCNEKAKPPCSAAAQADVLHAAARLSLETDPWRAENDMKEALRLVRESGLSIRLAEMLLSLGQVEQRLGRAEQARRSWRTGIEEIEKMRGELAEPQEKVRFLDARIALYDQLIELELEAGRVDEAARMLEDSRARTLKENLATRLPVDRQIDRLALDPNEAVVQYFLARSAIVSWVLTRDSAHMQKLAVDGGALRHLIRRVANDRDVTATEQLYGLLIAPLSERIAGKSRLVFVPDKELWSVPFGALRDPASKRYLVESFAVGIAPSSLSYLALCEQAKRRQGKAIESALLAAYGETPAEGGQSLLHASEEVNEIASLYDRPAVLAASEATFGNVLWQAADSDVIHLAAHSQDDRWRPWHSRLLLAPDPAAEHDGLVLAEELDRLAERCSFRARLVILAACSTGVAAPSASEGLGGLIQPFLSQGVPAVLASLWKVDDLASSQLLIAFHRHFRSGGDAPAALRSAQLELLETALSGPSLPDWFAFQAYGGT